MASKAASSPNPSVDHHNDAPPLDREEDESESGEEDEEEEDGEVEDQPHTEDESNPPLPDEAPPLPDEQPPLPDDAPPLPNEQPPDDGWEPVWDAVAQAFYFYNRITKATQWENPRLPTMSAPPGLTTHDRSSEDPSSTPVPKKSKAGGYNPAIHGDYDPEADYAQIADDSDDENQVTTVINSEGVYEAAGSFNRFTGRWQAAEINPDNHNDENKSKRQMNAFFDVDAAANSHDGRSLKAERQSKKFSKKEIKAFKEKRRDRKEEKRRAWLRD
jgi:hypothetical protein